VHSLDTLSVLQHILTYSSCVVKILQFMNIESYMQDKCKEKDSISSSIKSI
jgi:hypothetical protein